VKLEFSTNIEDMDLGMIHRFLSSSYWSENIPIDVVEKSLNNSLCFGCFVNGKQIGFGRAVTDYATFAYLADIFIIEHEQGKGYGGKLMAFIKGHSDLKYIKRWHLVTRDAQKLYSNFGFNSVINPERHMEIRVADIYKKL
jgi:N-acetylglutamate synthase-like GNAT family acetyltransferase